jgi:hypothetical protein
MKILTRFVVCLALMAGSAAPSAEASAQSLGRVGHLAARVNHQSVSFTWTNSSSTNGANIYVDGRKVFSWGWPYDYKDFTQWTDTDVALGRHTVRVIDYDAAGEGPSPAAVTFAVTQRSPSKPVTQPPSGAGQLGFYADGDQASRIKALGALLGVSPQIFATYTNGTSWRTIGDSTGVLKNPDHALRLLASVNMCIGTSRGEDLRATLHHLSVYRTFASRVYRAGYRKTIYRIGWESSGSYGGGGYCWTQEGSVLYKSDFRHIEAVIVKGDPTATFDWNVGYGADGVHFQNGQTASAWYPGRRWVTYITTDVYDNGYPDYTIDHTLENGYDLAAQFGKPWGISEWGQARTDSVAFMTAMEDMILGVPVINPLTGHPIRTVPPAYEVYFWGDGSQLTNFPNSERSYRQIGCWRASRCGRRT